MNRAPFKLQYLFVSLTLSVAVETSCIHSARAQGNAVVSAVYRWNSLSPVKEETRIRRQILDGTTTDLTQLEIHSTTLEPGKAPHPPHTHNDFEELIIIREGSLKVTIKDKSKVLGPGSIAYALPGDQHGFENGGPLPVTYYVLKYKGRQPIVNERGAEAGGSFMVDWNEMAVTKTERGERRNACDRATSMFERFEMHMTTLNEGLKSHEPHQHRAEEIILLIRGSAEMQIGEDHQQATPGDVVFLESQVLHNLSNVGKGPCQYFAFQWQEVKN